MQGRKQARRLPPRPSTVQTKPKPRPEWNEYLTDNSTYQLSRDQKLQKRIQMLTKIPTDIPRNRTSALTRSPRERAPLPSRTTVSTTLVSPRPTKVQRQPVAIVSTSRVNFDDELRAGDARKPTVLSATTKTEEKQQRKLQTELDRMDEMLQSLELQADQFSGAEDNDGEENNQQDLTDTTHNASTVVPDFAVPSIEPPRPPVDHDLLDLLHEMHAGLMAERRMREAQDTEIKQLRQTLEEVVQSHSSLREDFKRAVKHIVKLKTVVTTLSQTVERLEGAASAPTSTQPPAEPVQQRHDAVLKESPVVERRVLPHEEIEDRRSNQQEIPIIDVVADADNFQVPPRFHSRISVPRKPVDNNSRTRHHQGLPPDDSMSIRNPALYTGKRQPS
ncbi:hypothetical protein LEN26_007229 [Aphanomyces euteiches]|nr:hypothetical protein AeMF1_017403 [Aphanomyces euteiches]KAH9132968.1 hypothetical protein LEN26_007229 [Aphanomyces euteiches]KAH9186840.1 hypothetical protein AeNC1_011179 [Aphanomyces euteiches]